MKNDWDIPDRLPEGDLGAEPIYLSVGRALSSWERLESVLANLFSLFVGGNTLAGHRAYASIATFRGRSEMLQSAADEFFRGKPEDLSKFTGFLKEVARFSGRRNDIAHGECAIAHRDGGRFHQYLLPAVYNHKKYEGLEPKYAYVSSQIDDFREHFVRLTIQAMNMEQAWGDGTHPWIR